MFYQAMSVFLINFITEALNLPKETIGIITTLIVVLRILEMINDPIMGNVIDNTRTKWGKFKPWLLIGTVVASLSLVFLFSDFFGLAYSNTTLYILLFILVYLILDVSFALCDIGYWSMVPALSLTKIGRDKITSFARMCAAFGAALAVVLVIPIRSFFADLFGSIQIGWLCYAILVAVVAVGTISITLIGAKEEKSNIRLEEKTSIKDVFGVIAKNDQLLWSGLFIGLFATGSTITLSFGLYYFKYIFGDENMYTAFSGVIIISQVLMLVLFNAFGNKIPRKTLYMLTAASCFIGYVILFASGSSFATVAIAGFFIFSGQAIQQLLFVLFLSDAVEYGQWKNGTRHESTTLSVLPMLNKLGGAISNGVVGWTVIATGMIGGATKADITGSNVLIFKIIMMAVPLVLVGLAFLVFTKKFKLDEKMHEKIMVDLEKRAKGTKGAKGAKGKAVASKDTKGKRGTRS
jgi:melibiose permease/lactose/raffinose/galactose permease